MSRLTLFVLITLITFSACRRSDRDMDNDFSHCRDFAFASYTWIDIYARIHEVSLSESGLRMHECANVMVDTNTNPNQILIDYGTVPCTGNDGRIRSGKIFAAYTLDYFDSASVISITLQDYTFNGYGVSGTMQITNLGADATGNPKFRVNVPTSSMIHFATSKTMQWSCNNVLLFSAGSSSLTIADDLFSVSGSFSGKSLKGNNYTATVSENLNFSVSCNDIISGSVKLTPDNLLQRTLKFGTGTCDGLVSAEVSGFTEEWNAVGE